MGKTAQKWTEGGLDKGRIGTLVDGVFSIVMTLMVFEIKPPHLSGQTGSAELLSALIPLAPRFISHALTFVILGIYWIGHHSQFHYIRRSDRTLLWINIVYLLFVSILPFSTALLGDYPRDQVAVAIYGANFTVVGLVLYVHWAHATRGRHLVDDNLDLHLIWMRKLRVLTAPVICLISIAASFVSTRLSLALYGLILVFFLLPIGTGQPRPRLASIESDAPDEQVRAA